MTTYGMTSAGFVKKPVQQIVTDQNARVLGSVASDLDLDPEQPPGQMIGIQAEALGECWELLEVLANVINRADAEGALLDNIGTLTGTRRAKERPSFVPCTLHFQAAGTYAAGSLVAYVNGYPTARFTNVDQIVVPSKGDDGNPIGPTHLWSGQKTWLFQSLDMGPGSGNALVAVPGQLTQMVPVSGWHDIVDAGAGNVTIGALVEQDAPYRQRQRDELGAFGNDTLEATRAAILRALSTVVSGAGCQMYENTKLVFDPDTGLPGKSYMAVIYDGDVTNPTIKSTHDNLIGAAIWANKGGTARTYGSSSVDVVDSQGTTRTVFFTRATELAVALTMDVYVDASMSTLDQDNLKLAIRQALADAAQGSPFTMFGATVTPTSNTITTLRPGFDFVASAFKAIVQGQTGVIDVQNFAATSPTPEANGNVAVAIDQFASLSTGSITVNIFPFVP